MTGTALADWERALLGYARLGNTAAAAGVLWAWFSPAEVEALVARLLVLRARSAAMQEDEEGKRGSPRARASSAGACSDARGSHSRAAARGGGDEMETAATTLDTERLADEGSGWIRLPREPGRAAERIRATYSADERDELIALLLAMGSSGERRAASGERRRRGSDGEPPTRQRGAAQNDLRA